VAEARDHECSVIAFEDLTDIRDRAGASWGHKWAFNRLYEYVEYVEYKAAEYGIGVEQVDPENTSRRCSHCGFTHPDNRESESFECQKCGHESHADCNAAKNIGLRYLRRNQTGGDEGAPLGVRLNSGTLNVNGEYESPASTEARTGVHAESHRFTVVADSTARTAEEELRLRLCSSSTLPSEESGCRLLAKNLRRGLFWQSRQ